VLKFEHYASQLPKDKGCFSSATPPFGKGGGLFYGQKEVTNIEIDQPESRFDRS
jgi:hypothetical protein